MKSNATIELDFLAGTSIKDAVTEAKQKARMFDVAYVKFNFNGVRMSIGRDADVKQAAKDFRKQLGEENKFVVAN